MGGMQGEEWTDISIVSVEETEKWKSLKSDSREIQLNHVIDIAKIYPRCVLDKSKFIFCIYLFGMCVGMH